MNVYLFLDIVRFFCAFKFQWCFICTIFSCAPSKISRFINASLSKIISDSEYIQSKWLAIHSFYNGFFRGSADDAKHQLFCEITWFHYFLVSYTLGKVLVDDSVSLTPLCCYFRILSRVQNLT